MKRFHVLALGLLLICAASVTGAANIDRDTVKIRAIEPPLVNVAMIDFNGLTAEVAYGTYEIGEPVLRTTTSVCAPEHSENKFKDADTYTTYYYEVPFKTDTGVMLIHDAAGELIYSDRLSSIDGSERWGYNTCRFYLKSNLEEAFKGKMITIEKMIEKSVAEYFELAADRAMDDALFFNVLEEKVAVYRFKYKRYDYADLNRAFDLAVAGYSAGATGESDLWKAVEIWEKALEESDLNDKQARINRKVSVRLYQSLGIANLVLGDYSTSVNMFEKAQRYTSMSTSRTSGTGTVDLIQRARERKHRNRQNPDLPTDPAELDKLIASVERFRGQVPVRLLPTSELARLREVHASRAIGGAFVAHVEEVSEQQAAVEAGLENPYERQVGRTAAQGFYLFLMPYGGKLDEFPVAITELTHLNQLRMPKHGFVLVPETIGNLEHLKFLDLSGNKIERLPDTIGNLKNLKTLKIKDNPLAPGELERLKNLLPGCKIKG